MTLLNSVISWLIKKRIHQIELFKKYPLDVQQEVFTKLIQSAKDTEWGKKYDYKSIRNINDFKSRVPISDYESIKPWIERIMKGEQNLLWPSEIKWFAKSSGTTNDKSKFIPVSNEAIEECHIKGGKDLLAIYYNNYPNAKIFDGKTLALGGSHKIIEINSKAYYGDLSAILIQNLPFWAEFKRIPNLSIALMEEWENKIKLIAKTSINSDVTCLAGVPSWTLILLRKIIEITGKNDISEIWPNLEVFFHGGVDFTPYHKQFTKIISSPNMHYINNYNASEGFFGIQDQTESDELLLMLDYGIFYEFIPIENINDNNPDSLSLSDVKTNKNYAMIISTNAGLWRYIIGDTIKFTSLNPYRIIISGRTKHFINAVGEELIVENADKAITIACQKTNAIINEYTVAPIYFDDNKNAAHEWLIEFEQQPHNMEIFADVLDNAIKSQNSDYEAKRYHNLILRAPIIKSIPKGTFYKWLKYKGKLGGQHKVPRLSNNRKIIDEILNLI
ncbi:MAG TPA: GH3 auxin-responsive promoter family protein [Bacteroidales bacterium]|nr:GH3 auxin-responsive promoter family protein [Bacteroidales bacterium]